jgi:hypothetical protein
MSLSFLLPAAWAALAALLVPIALHLQRRRQLAQTLSFAALRWLPAPTRPRQRWQLRQPWLLLLRCLLLASLVAAQAQPLLDGFAPAKPWHVAVPGIDPARIVWPDQAVERRWLAPGFPPLLAAVPSERPATASLLRELDARLPPSTPLTVYVPPRLHGLDGERIALGRTLDWVVVDPAPGTASDSAPIERPLQLAIGGRAEADPADRFIDAARAAWQAERAAGGGAPSTVTIGADGAPAAGTDSVLWLSSDPLPPALHDWLADGGRLLALGSGDDSGDDSGSDRSNGQPAMTIWHNAHGARVDAHRVGRGVLRRLDCPLQPDCLPELLDPGFPALLQRWLDAPPAAPTDAYAEQARPIRIERQAPPAGQPLATWLALLAAALFVLERWLASRRQRR